jgi:hypothetical protein
MALVCVPSTSAPNPQNVLLISAKPSLSTKSTILPSESSPEEITASRLSHKISLLPKIHRKYSIEKLQHTSSLKKLQISRKSERSKKEIKSKSGDVGRVNSLNTCIKAENAEKEVGKTDIHS